MFARAQTVSRTALSRGMATRTPIVGGNWKLNAGNGTSKATVTELVNGLNALPTPNCEVYIAPPALYLDAVGSTASSTFNVTAQNVYKEPKGAFTGENSAAMIKDAGITWTLIGHSERRDIFGETDELLGQKIAFAQSEGLTVVACCGEQKEAREAGNYMDVLIPQVKAICDNTSDWSRMVIAYEPVWAIGTGLVATPEQAQDTCAEIRQWISANVSAEVADNVRIQYGGSVNADNAANLAGQPDIDGFLVGGACLKADSFGVILAAF
jgi:triosephosphate isomerase